MIDPALILSAIELIDEAVVITSPELDAPGPYIEYVNAGFTRMSGYEAEEVVGKTPRMLQGAETDRAVLERMRRELAATGSFLGEAVNYRKDGSDYVVEWRIRAIRNDAGAVTQWLAVQRDITRRKRAEEAQRRLLREVDHRAKNALALVQGIVRLSRADDIASYAQAIQGRVEALARAHALLAERRWGSLSLKRLVEAEIAPCACGRVTLHGIDVVLHPQLVQPIALVIHEMIRNAVEHGALTCDGGHVQLDWNTSKEPAQVGLVWCETGGPPPQDVTRQGFGRTMISSIIRRQLRGKLSEEWRTEGLKMNLTIPLRSV